MKTGTKIKLAIIFGLFATFKNPLWVDSEGTMKTLNSQGYKMIEETGYRWLKCIPDHYCTGFEAKNSNGHDVSGAVSRGMFSKKATIKFD